MAQQLVNRVEVEVHLARELGLGRLDLQIDHYKCPQDVVVEQKVQVVVLFPNFYVVLTADEGESLPEFEKKVLEVIEKRPLQLAFAKLIRDPEELQVVGILDQFAR